MSMAAGSSIVRVTQPVWLGHDHGWLTPPDVVTLSDDEAERVLELDPRASIEQAPAPKRQVRKAQQSSDKG